MDHSNNNRQQEPALSVQDVTHAYRQGDVETAVLQGVSFEVAPGETVAIVGPSGSGKSTLLWLIAGIEPLQRGSLSAGGLDVGSLSDQHVHEYRRKTVGLIFQNFNLLPALTALENVSLPLEIDGAPKQQAREEGLAALQSVGIDELADRFPDQLSGGQQQRVAIARAISGNRKILLADEPTGALDSHTADGVMDTLNALVHNGASALIVTHDEGIAKSCDRVLRLFDGVLSSEVAL